VAHKSKVLIVEDDASIRQSLTATLNALGFATGEADSGAEALHCLSTISYDAVLLDINMPGMGGKETCGQIFRTYPRLPIIMLTVRDAQSDIIESLDAGAWDYVTKPFQILELTARLRAVIRRNDASVQKDGTVRIIGDITLYLDRRVVEKRGKEIHLSPKEYETLSFLVQNAGRPMRHEHLLTFAGGPHQGGEREYLRVIINQLRKKIEDDPSRPTYILTENHIGYRFRKD
jgi:two-component system KDP operon response regulator KdpE